MFEIRPDLFPYDHLTDEEIMLWEEYYGWLKEQREGNK